MGVYMLLREVQEHSSHLCSIRVKDKKARAAATALKEQRDEAWKRNVEQRLSALEGKMTLMQWMFSVNLTLTTAVLFKVLMA